MQSLLHYKQLFIKGDVILGEYNIFGVEIFLRYRRFFIKGDFIIGGAECIVPVVIGALNLSDSLFTGMLTPSHIT